MLDLTTLDTATAADAGSIMEVLHPTTGAVLTHEGGKAVTITLAGQDSARYQGAARASRNRRLKAQQSGRRVQISAEEMENDGIETIVSCTLGWDGIGVDGAPLPFSPDNARMLYKRLPWLLEQADAFISDRANFLKASAKI
jgi:hypothetical protein